jgi:GNAT superfamily N-acetyltransferase
MIFREAGIADFEQLHRIRMAVRENPLPDAGLITAKDYEDFLTRRGKGWLCEIDDRVVGFAIVDLEGNNIWALFIEPEYEGKGIGKKLHDDMLDWYFSQTKKTVWLGTSPDTRAGQFYRKAGWKQTGIRPNGEIRFEMSAEDWKNNKYFENAKFKN